MPPPPQSNPETQVRSWGFSHVFTWTDGTNARIYPPFKPHLTLQSERLPSTLPLRPNHAPHPLRPTHHRLPRRRQQQHQDDLFRRRPHRRRRRARARGLGGVRGVYVCYWGVRRGRVWASLLDFYGVTASTPHHAMCLPSPTPGG